MVTQRPIMELIDTFFSKPKLHPGDNQLFVLSDAGMGKTTLLTMLKLFHLTSFWPKQTDCVLKKLGENTLVQQLGSSSPTLKTIDSLGYLQKSGGGTSELQY